MAHDGHLILAIGGVLAACVAAAGLATRLRLPALVLFAALGMLVGSDGLGWIAFDDYRLARLIGTVALTLILFEGGLASG
jgi:cell volume regulation protein A